MMTAVAMALIPSSDPVSIGDKSPIGLAYLLRLLNKTRRARFYDCKFICFVRDTESMRCRPHSPTQYAETVAKVEHTTFSDCTLLHFLCHTHLGPITPEPVNKSHEKPP